MNAAAPDAGSPAHLIELAGITKVYGAPGTITRIPFTIADRQVRATADVVDAFLTVLRTLRGRLAAPDVVDLLERRPIAARFGISDGDLELIRDWVRESGIRWGADAAHRQDEQQPALAQNTWTFGLDRLLLGYAMPGEHRGLFGGVLPYDDVEGTAAEALGKLCQFCSELFAFRTSLQPARPVSQWGDDLGRLPSGDGGDSPQRRAFQRCRAAAAADRRHGAGPLRSVRLPLAARSRCQLPASR